MTAVAPPGVSRLPPQALDAEQSVLGGLLLDSRRWEETPVSAILRTRAFDRVRRAESRAAAPHGLSKVCFLSLIHI